MSSTSSGISRQDDSRSHVMIDIVCSLLPLVTVVTGLRLWTRATIVRSFGFDDWVIVLALIFTICTGVVMGVMTTHGLGKHIETLPAGMVEFYLYDFWLSILFYYTSLGLIKLAILLQYYPLVAVKSKSLMIVIITAICAWSIALVFISIFNCIPIEGFWKTDIGARCIPNLPLWYINAGGNIITDIVIFALPIPIVWKLKMPGAQRLSLIAVFGLGFFTCTISIIRIDFLNIGSDFTYTNVGPAGWSLGEICAGIICACLPTLRPLLFRVVPAPRSLPRMKFSRYIKHSDGKNRLTSRVSAEDRDGFGSGSDGSVDSYAMKTTTTITTRTPTPAKTTSRAPTPRAPTPGKTITASNLSANTTLMTKPGLVIEEIGELEAANRSTESLTPPPTFRNVM